MFFTSVRGTAPDAQHHHLGTDSQGNWVMPDSLAIFTADFSRNGQDLIIKTIDGLEARLVGYFNTEVSADILTHDGAVLRGSVVDRLAGPVFPAQYAQAGGASLAEAIGQVETLTGAAFVQRTDGSTVELLIGTKVFQGDVVRTEGGSTLGLTFADGTIFTLASGSRMVLDELIYDPQATDNSGVFNLVEGSFVFIAGQTAKTGGIEINSPAATMGIRGTTGKIDIQTTNGITTVTVSLNPDPDGGLGAIELFDLAGNLITTITGTDTKWIISPPFTNEPPIEVDREAADIGDDSVLLSQALAAYQSAVTRVQQGQTFVELPEGDGDDPQDGPADTQDGLEETDEPPQQTDPIVPPPLDEEGDDTGDGTESGTGNPELDGNDEQIIDEEPGGNEQDDAALTPPAPTQTTQVADTGSRPQLADLAVQSTEDTSFTARVPVSGGNSGEVAVSLLRGAENGLVVLATDGTFTYTPNPDFEGTDTFQVVGTQPDGTVQTAQITVVVDPVNDAPVVSARIAQATSFEAGAGIPADSGALTGTLTYLDVDEGATPGTWQIAADDGNETAFGTISIDAATGVWTYDLDQEAADALTDGDVVEETYLATVTDAQGASDVTTLVVTVTGTNDAPEIVAAVEQTSAAFVTGPRVDEFEGTELITTGSVSGVLGYTDVDEGAEAATWSIAADPDNETELGEITIDAVTGRWSYILSDDPADAPGNGVTVSETYTATVTDAQGATATQTISISVTGTNDAPEIVFSIEDVSARVVEGGFSTDTTVSASRVAVDQDGLRQSRVDPDSEQSFERTQSNTADGPSATGTLRYVDADGTPGAATWSVAPQDASLGTMTIDPVTGQWRYFLDEEAANSLREGDEVIETFLATVTDPFGATASQVITITVEGSNDEAEIITSPQDLVGAVTEDGVSTATGKLNFVDPDAAPGETATWSVRPDGTSRGTMQIDEVSGAWTYTLNQGAAQNLKGGETATETFTATVTDSLGATADQTITITLTGQNDAPVLVSGTGMLAKQEPTLTIDLAALGSDPDAGESGSTLSYAITTPPGEGGATINGTDLIFSTDEAFNDLSEGESRDVTVQISATDGAGVTVPGSVTITVTGTNTAPIITSSPAAAQGSVTEDVPTGDGIAVSVSGTLSYSDEDASTPTSGIWSVAPVATARGSMSIDPVTGAWTYLLNGPAKDSLNAGEVATERFTATITDEDGQVDTQQITIDITGTNDAPILSAGSGAVEKDTAILTIDLAALGSDPDGEDDGSTLTYALDSGPSLFVAEIPPAGIASVEGTNLFFRPAGDFDDLSDGQSRSVVVRVSATDAQGASTSADITITVTGSSTSPVITSDAAEALGSVTEAGNGQPGSASVTGQLAYDDPDAATPISGTWTITPLATALGTISINPETGLWTYQLNDGAANSLDQGDSVQELFTATITDADGLSDTQQIAVTINGNNDRATLSASTRSVGKDAGSVVVDLADFANDPDADDTDATLGFAIEGAPELGTTTLLGSVLTFELGEDFDDLDAGESREVVINLSVEDTLGAGQANTLTITVTGSNDAPVITSTLADARGEANEVGIGVPVSEGAVATGTLAFSDEDEGATWSIAPLAEGSIGTASIGATTGVWEYFLTPTAGDSLAEGQVVTDRFVATVEDIFGLTATQEIAITLTGTNDAPVIDVATSELTGRTDGAEAVLTGQVTVDDPDVIVSDAAVWDIRPAGEGAPEFGTMTISQAGVWRYEADAAAVEALSDGQTGTDTFAGTVTDEFGAQALFFVKVYIDGTNQPPVITSVEADAAGTITEVGDNGLPDPNMVGGTLTFDDPDQTDNTGVWMVAPIGEPSLGNVVIDPGTGVWTYTLNAISSDALDQGDSVQEQFLATVTVPQTSPSIPDITEITATQVITVTITGTNDSPALVASTTPVGQNATANVDLRAIATDVDADDTPADLTFAIVSGPARGTATLLDGVLTFDTDNAFADLSDGSAEAVVVRVSVTDPLGASTITDLTFQVNGANDAPVIDLANSVIAGTIKEQGVGVETLGSTIGAALRYTDSDETESAPGTWSISPQDTPLGAMTIGASNGLWQYTLDQGAADALNEGETRTETFTATITDASLATAQQTVTITIQGTNDAPTLSAGVLGATEDGGPVTLDLATLGDDPDAEDTGATLTYGLDGEPEGTGVSGAILTFDPGAGFQALAAGETAQQTVTITAQDARGATVQNDVTVTITGVNDTPTFVAGALGATEDGGAVTLDLSTLGDDIDAGQDGTTLSYALQAPVDGAAITGTTLTYTPPASLQALTAGQNLPIPLNIVVSDGAGGEVVGTVTVTVAGSNDAPVVGDGTLDATEDGEVVTFDLTSIGSDIDANEDGSTLTYALAGGEAPNSVIVGTELRFDPAGDFQALPQGGIQTISIDVIGEDALGLQDTGTITVTVTGVNDAPDLLPGTPFVTENGSETLLNLRFLADDPDAGEDGSTLSYSLVTPHPNATVNGSFLLVNAQTNFEHLVQGETEQFTLQVQAEDALGLTDVEDYVVTVTGQNDDPTMQDAAFSVNEDGPANTLDVSTLGDDVDGNDDGSTLNYRLLGETPGASLVGTTLTFDPTGLYDNLAGEQTQEVQLTVEAEDSSGRTTTGTVTVTVNGANDAPQIADATLAVTEDGGPVSISLTSLGSDLDDGETGSTLDYFLPSAVAGASIIASDGGPRLQFDPGTDFQNLAAGATQDIVVTVGAVDDGEAQGTGDVTVTVTGVNDAPTFTDVGTGVSEDAAQFSLDLSAFADDADDGEDGTTLTYHIISGPAKGLATIDGTTITFQPNGEFEALGAGETESIGIQVEARDGTGASSATRTVTFTVTGANDAPTTPDTAVDYDFVTTPIEVDVLALASDVDGDAFILDSVGEAAKGVVSIDGNSTEDPADDTILYTADAGALGTDSFTYTIQDENGATSSGTVTVNLLNTAPTVIDEAFSVQMDSRRGAAFFDADSSFYKFVRGYHTWDEANANATAQGGRLASIRSSEENTFASNLLVNTDVDAWLGGSDAAIEGDWRWVSDGNDAFWTGDLSGVAVGGAFENWAEGQPQAIAVDTADHLVMQRFDGGIWDDAINADGRGYLIEYGADPQGVSVAVNDSDGDLGDTLTYTLDAPVDGVTLSSDGFVTFDVHSDAYAALAQGETQNVDVNYTATDRAGATGQGTLTLTVTGDNDAPDVVDDVAQITLQDVAGTPTTGGWTEWTIASGGNGHFYKLYEAPFLTRNQAEAARAAEGAHLATITSAAENAFLTNNVAPNFAGIIGGGDQAIEGEWRWTGGPETGQQFWQGTSTGSAVNGAYENWKSGRPSAALADGFDVLFFDRDGTWFTVSEPTTANHYAEFSDTQFATGSVALNDSDVDGDAITYALSGSYAGLTMAADGRWTFDRLDPAYEALADGEMAFVNAYYVATDANGATSDGRLRLELTGVNNAPDVTDTTVDVDAGNIGTPSGTGWLEWTQASGGNGHFYQFVAGTTNWSDARADAVLKGGHLATITSAGEQAFIDGLPGSSSVGWLGASDGIQEGTWIWVDGPETGQRFWQGTASGTAVNGAYTNWNQSPAQPLAGNAPTEDVLHTFGDGTWNDITESSTLAGYYLEYSGTPIVTGSIAATASDPEGDMLTFAATSALAGVALDGAGNWTFDSGDAAYAYLAAGEVETFDLTYSVTDANGAVSTGTLGFNVTGVNDAPVFADLDLGSVDENAAQQSFDLLAGVTDADTTDTISLRNFTYQWTGDGPSPEFELTGGSTLEIDPGDFRTLNAGETATLEMTYDVFDGTVEVQRNATFAITGVTDPIAANDDNLSPEGAPLTDEDIPETILASTLLGNDTDPEGLGISIVGVSQYSDQGASLILSSGNIFYNPTTSSVLNSLAAGQEATDTFTYTIQSNDGLQQDTATVSLIVEGLAPSADSNPVVFSVDGEGFEQGSANVYQVNPIFFRDNDAFTGITYKFSQTFVDGALPDFLTFDAVFRNLTVNANFTPGDAGTRILALSGFEADGDFTVSPFWANIGADGDFNWTLYGQNNAIGVPELLEVGIDSNFGLGDIVSGVLVDLSGLGAPLADVEIIDIRNAQENDLTIDVDDVLALVTGNGANANEQIHVDIDIFDQFDIAAAPADWTLTSTGSNTTQLAAVNGGAFDGMGVLATFYVDDGGSA